MQLNCDMGEGMPFDAEIMPLIDMANLACGAHAGDEALMRTNVRLAKKHGVVIGAHPAYPDRENFGRVSMQMAPARLGQLLREQIERLDRICSDEGVTLSYVKPHGALYNDMMRDERIFETIAEAIASYRSDLQLMMLSTPDNGRYRLLSQRYGIALLYELFADRNYTDQGYLQPRVEQNAVIHNVDHIVERIVSYGRTGVLRSIGGKSLQLEGDMLCVHGDNEASLAVIKALRDVL